MKEKFQVYVFENGNIVAFKGDEDLPVGYFRRFNLWNWLRIWWAMR